MLKILDAIREEIFGDEREFDSPHAPTVVEIDGVVIAAWFGGRFEKDPDTAIWTARRIGGIWEKPVRTIDVRNIAAWNPVLFCIDETTVALYFKIGETIGTWHTEYVTSSDCGVTWSKAAEVVKGDIGGRGPVKNKPVYLADGTIIAPASLEGDCWDSFADISYDNGVTWKKSENVPLRRINPSERRIRDRVYNKHYCYGKGIIQPTIWEDSEGIVHMLCRSTSSRIFKSESHDKGRTWTLAYDTGLPNNNSGIDAVKLNNGTIVLACNPRENIPGMTKGARTPLVLLYSEDNGATWKELYVLENTDGAFAYPSIICNDKEIMVVYSENREKIIYWKLSYESN